MEIVKRQATVLSTATTAQIRPGRRVSLSGPFARAHPGCNKFGALRSHRASCAILHLLSATLLLFCGASVTKGAVVTAASASLTDVAAAITKAVAGDTVAIPAGTSTWASNLTINKAITLMGAGIDVTTIIDNIPKVAGTQMSPIVFNTTTGTYPRATGFTIRGLAQDTNKCNKAELAMFGSCKTFRIDHVKFDKPGTLCIQIMGDLWGVIDHCVFNTPNFKQDVQIYHPSWGGSGNYGDGSFNEGLYYGTEKAVYIEDCTAIGSGMAGAGVTDATYGGRFVVRHCTITNDNIGTHGTETSRIRGVRSYEIYQNTMTQGSISTYPMMFCAVYLRGGSGVIWGNSWNGVGGETGYKSGIVMSVYRANGQYGSPWMVCNGSAPFDGNTTSAGYPAIDQVGRGTCADALTGTTSNDTTGASTVDAKTLTKTWPHQASEPVYYWSNNWVPITNNAGTLAGADDTASRNLIQAGREYVDLGTTPLAGYTPYTYPHPLTTRSDTTLAPPTNLQIQAGP